MENKMSMTGSLSMRVNRVEQPPLLVLLSLVTGYSIG